MSGVLERSSGFRNVSAFLFSGAGIFPRACQCFCVTVTGMSSQRYQPVDVDDLVHPYGRHERWLRCALYTAASSKHRTRMGAVAVCSGRILGEGVNTRKNRPVSIDWHHVSRHAEQALAAKADLERSTVYVARLLKDGRDACARPCEFCLARLKDAGVRTVVWTAGNGLIGIDRID
jgi:hypothetical protein